jgi:membrane-associated protein
MMESIIQFINDYILHLDKTLETIVPQFGIWIILILFLVIFMETGLVVTPFLPGDSLLFAVGALVARGLIPINIFIVWAILMAAAVLGDTVNYWIGHYVGPRVFSEKVRFLKREYLIQAHEFYEKHGNMTIFLARFIPSLRTFAPFVAGIGRMSYGHFISYNIFGGIVWTALFTFMGFGIGKVQWVQDNFSVIVILIILISLVPVIFEVVKSRRKAALDRNPGS